MSACVSWFLLVAIGCASASYSPSRMERDAIPCLAYVVGGPSKIDEYAAKLIQFRTRVVSDTCRTLYYQALVVIVQQLTFKLEKSDPDSVRAYWKDWIDKYVDAKTADGEDVSILSTPQGESLKIKVTCRNGIVPSLNVTGDGRNEKSLSQLLRCNGISVILQSVFYSVWWTQGKAMNPIKCASRLLAPLCEQGEIQGFDAFMMAVMPTKPMCAEAEKAESKPAAPAQKTDKKPGEKPT